MSGPEDHTRLGERSTAPPAIGPDAEWHYAELDRLSRVLQAPRPFDAFLDAVLSTVREMVGAEIAWLLRDVVVDGAEVTVVAESAAPGQPAVTGRARAPLDDQARDLLARALNRSGPATLIFARPATPGPLARESEVLSQMAAAIRPEGELPWIIGLDRRQAPAAWSVAERRLFGAAADRIGQALVQRLLVERLRAELEARRRIELALGEHERRMGRLIDASPDIICFKDGAGCWLQANEAHLRLFELSGEDYRGRSGNQLASGTHPRFAEVFAACQESDERAWVSGAVTRAEQTIPSLSGEALVLDVIKVPTFHPDGRRQGMIVIGRDITARRAAEAAWRIAAAAMEHGGEALVVVDREGRITQVNRAYERLFGRLRASVIGAQVADPTRTGLPFELGERLGLARGRPWSGEVQGQRADGALLSLWMTVSAVPDEQGVVGHFVIVAADISPLRASEAALEHMANHDPLTGLANRTGFEQLLARLLAAGPAPVEVLALDLDGFKHINDSLGHLAGDSVLVQVAERLRRMIGGAGHVGRIGGDDFAVAVDRRHLDQPDRLHERLMALFTAPLTVEGRELVVTGCAGSARCPQDAAEAGPLLRCAVAAVHRAKAAGPATLRAFNPIMTAEAAERIELENALRRTIQAGGPEIAYQPIVDLRRGQIVGFEALARWSHPVRGPISPDRFIPLAEEAGLIVALGDNVLRSACRQAARWVAAGRHLQYVSVNVSGRQLDDPTFFERVADSLAQAGLRPDQIELEVTESVLMGHPEQALRSLRALRSLGVRLAIDDFGTGYSSLAHLKHLPVHKLKLDRSFVCDLPGDAHDAAIARAVMALGRSLDFTVVAEGVETPEQFAFLRGLGCDLIQGYLCGRPTPAGIAPFELPPGAGG